MTYLTHVVDSALAQINDMHNNEELGHFASHVTGFSRFTVNFPDNTSRDTTDELKAEEIARTWLANRMGKQDDPTWQPSRTTMHDLGITITGLLSVTY